MGFWRAGPMHCFGAGFPSSTTGTAGSTNCGLKTAASALKAPGMTGVDSTGASVTTSCFGTRTTRTRPALFSRNVNSPPWDALTLERAPTPNRARRAFDRSTAVNAFSEADAKMLTTSRTTAASSSRVARSTGAARRCCRSHRGSTCGTSSSDDETAAGPTTATWFRGLSCSKRHLSGYLDYRPHKPPKWTLIML